MSNQFSNVKTKNSTKTKQEDRYDITYAPGTPKGFPVGDSYDNRNILLIQTRANLLPLEFKRYFETY